MAATPSPDSPGVHENFCANAKPLFKPQKRLLFTGQGSQTMPPSTFRVNAVDNLCRHLPGHCQAFPDNLLIFQWKNAPHLMPGRRPKPAPPAPANVFRPDYRSHTHLQCRPGKDCAFLGMLYFLIIRKHQTGIPFFYSLHTIGDTRKRNVRQKWYIFNFNKER